MQQPIGGEGPGQSPLTSAQTTSPSTTSTPPGDVATPERAPDQVVLIAHKCRGKLEFELALKWDFGTKSDPAPWFLSQSTGHRFYPIWHMPFACPSLSSLGFTQAELEKHRDFWEVVDRAPPPAKKQAIVRSVKTIDDLI